MAKQVREKTIILAMDLDEILCVSLLNQNKALIRICIFFFFYCMKGVEVFCETENAVIA